MSDDPLPATYPGTLSPRDIDTRTYRVVAELPRHNLPAVGAIFRAWAQGEVFANIIGYGPIASNGEIAAWLADGLIERVPS